MMKNPLLSLFFISALLLWPAPAPVAAQTIYVDDDANIGGNGQTWPTAYNYLQHALAVAVMDDEIWVAEGTYKPDEDTANPGGTDDRTATFQLKNDLAIYGGFPSGGGKWQERYPNVYETILSGDLVASTVFAGTSRDFAPPFTMELPRRRKLLTVQGDFG